MKYACSALFPLAFLAAWMWTVFGPNPEVKLPDPDE